MLNKVYKRTTLQQYSMFKKYLALLLAFFFVAYMGLDDLQFKVVATGFGIVFMLLLYFDQFSKDHDVAPIQSNEPEYEDPDVMLDIPSWKRHGVDIDPNTFTKNSSNKDDIVISQENMESLWKWADNNKIPVSCLPRDAEELQNLTILDLSAREITSLPSELGLLHTLQVLDLDNNLLTELPNEFRRLVNLHTLKLSSNKFKRRPAVLALLPNIIILTLKNNKIYKPSPEVEAFNYLAGDVAHQRAGVRYDDESNLLNREGGESNIYDLWEAHKKKLETNGESL